MFKPQRGEKKEQPKGGQISQTVPVDSQRPELQRDGIDLGMN